MVELESILNLIVRLCQQLKTTIHHQLHYNPIIGWKILSLYMFDTEGKAAATSSYYSASG